MILMNSILFLFIKKIASIFREMNSIVLIRIIAIGLGDRLIEA